MTLVLGALIGPLFVLGAFAVVAAWRPPQPSGRRRHPRVVLRSVVPASWSERALLRLLLGVAALLVVGVGTGWPAAALLSGFAAAAAPSLLGAKARRQAAVARIEAIASWTEQLRDVMAAAEGIQAAIVATGPVAPAPIQLEVRRLVDRLSVRRERLRPALSQFVDEMDHPLADMVVASLLLAAEHQGAPGDMLSEVAASARRTATMRLDVEASRANTYVTTRLILIVTVAMSAWLVIGEHDYMAPYSTALGQVVLLLIGGLFGVASWRMNRMAQPVEPDRLLTGIADREFVR